MPAAKTSRAARPVPASIPMPDSPVRHRTWYQIYARLARPTLDWVGVIGGAHAFGLLDRWLPPMPDGKTVIVLGFIALLYGLRSAEKRMGVA